MLRAGLLQTDYFKSPNSNAPSISDLDHVDCHKSLASSPEGLPPTQRVFVYQMSHGRNYFRTRSIVNKVHPNIMNALLDANADKNWENQIIRTVNG